VQRLDILPVFLEQRNEEVDTQHHVAEDLVIIHLNVANGDTQAENLLELELDGGADLSQLVTKVLSVRDGRRELAGLGETGTQETRNLLDEGLRSKESVELLGKLLDELLVLVELLQIISRHILKFDLLSTIDVSSIGENADAHAGTRHMRKLDGARETLVTLRVVVLETDLKLNGLDEVARLLLGFSQELLD